MCRYWVAHPPVHLLMQALVGYRGGSGSAVRDKSNLADLIAMMGPDGVLSAHGMGRHR